MNILVLSPHRDDAAFSLALSIASWLRAGHRVTILNVFTRSLDAPYSDAESVHENDRLSYVSAMRRHEDEAFVKHMPPRLTMVDLNLKDAPIRLRCDRALVCEVEMLPEDSAIAKIRKALVGHIGDGGKSCLVVPLALGHHVDHRVVREAALPLTSALPCAFYEDLPYALGEGVRVDLSQFREDESTRAFETLSPVFCYGTASQSVDWKIKIALLYISQVDRADAEGMAAFSQRYGGAERLWANEAWTGIAEAERLSSPLPR